MDIRSLVVFPLLKVHNINVEPKRVKAVYTIVKNDGSEEKNDLIYSYDNTYFDRKNPNDVNLASLMVVQVALNYGLFFENIEFDGLFDQADQRFLHDMMENTSKEILVNKFLSKNEFLKPPFDTITAEKMDRYSAAKLTFTNTRFYHLALKQDSAKTDKSHYAILSSGGKDSLLTYGLIKEIG